MQRALVWLRALLHREAGQGLVEYLLVLSLVAIGTMSALSGLSRFLTGPLHEMITDALNTIPGVK